MKFLDSDASVQCIDAGIRNPWKWSWLEEKCEEDVLFTSWCKKVDEQGKCFCVPCSKILNYGSSGKRALKLHANNSDHRKNVLSVKNNSIFVANTVNAERKTTLCTISDKSDEIKAVTGLFLAQHCLPFTMAPELLAFAKRVSTDPKVLHSVSLQRTAATYVTTHGVGHSIKLSLAEKLAKTHFSLNVDEATNNAHNKVLNVLVQYFDTDEMKCIVQLLGSRIVNEANAKNLVDALSGMLTERGLGWHQVVSILMDNCNVMRGRKEGVEAKIRRLNPSLLDISGDTVHILNNAARKFFEPVELNFVAFQSVASDVYYDIEDSPKARSLFHTVQDILFKKTRAVIRPIPNRFNQMLMVANRFHELWGALLVYYSAFLKPEDKKHHSVVSSVMGKFDLTDSEKSTIQAILEGQRKQAKTLANKDRKIRILYAIFDSQIQTTVAMHLYRGILGRFEHFIKKFQANKPLAHCLHVEMFDLQKDFFSYFIKAENIPTCEAKKLEALDFLDKDLQLRNTDLFVGEYCKPILLISSKNKQEHGHWLKKLYDSVREGYIKSAVGMRKLPLLNSALVKLSATSPSHQRSSATASALSSLAMSLPNVIKEEELGMLDLELKGYTTDNDISLLPVDEEDVDFRIDESWWGTIMRLKGKKYPLLCGLMQALLTVFSGPLVESTFNIMDDIIEDDDRTRLSLKNYEALAMIKSHISARKGDALTMHISRDMKNSVATSYQRYENCLEEQRQRREKSRRGEVSEPSTSVVSTSSSSSIVSTSSSSSSTSLLTCAGPLKPPGQPLKTPGLPLKRKQPSLTSFFSKYPRT